jgi:WD40 repeat protein
VKIWNLYTGTCELTLKGHKTGTVVACIVELPNGVVVTGGFDDTVRFWSLYNPILSAFFTTKQHNIKTIMGKRQKRCHVIILINGNELACGSGENINIYGVDDISDEPRRVLLGAKGLVKDLLLLEDQDTLISALGRGGGSCVFWSLKTGTQICVYNSNTNAINNIMLFNKDVLIATSINEDMMFWNMGTANEERRIITHETGIGSVNIRSDGVMVTCGGDGRIRYWY